MTRPPHSLQSMFAEMKRRRVFRVMAVYGAVAFVVLQVADIVFPALELPDWTLRMLVALTMFGFPIAIVLAWAFESTPDGVRRTAPAAREEIEQIIAQPMSRRWPSGLLALGGLLLMFGGGWWVGNRGSGEGAAGTLVAEAQAADLRSIAVLPFEDMNGTDENRLIAGGVHEDLLSQMSRIGALRVTSRTSVREYEDTEKSLRQIAEDLGVEYIMEGSVRSSGDQVRVNVTLVDAGTDEAIWNDQFDETVTPENLFQIQSQIARQVVAALEARLTPQDEESLDAMQPASSFAAQQWYYRGLDAYAEGLTGLERARSALARAVEIDPDFTAAWSSLARVESRMLFIGQTNDDDAARAAVDRTVALAPGSVEAHLASGYYHYYGQKDFEAAGAAFREAERLAPSDADVVWALGLILRRQGEWRESTEMMKRAARLDPRNSLRLETLAENLQYIGAHEDVDAITERQLAIEPTNARARARKVLNLVEIDGDTDRALSLAGELSLDPTHDEESWALQWLAMADDDFQRVVELAGQVDAGGINLLELGGRLGRALALRQLGDPSAGLVADSVLADPALNLLDGSDDRRALRAMAHAVSGRRDDAVREARSAEQAIRRWDDHVVDPEFALRIVHAYGLVGELDAGFDLLGEVVRMPSDDFSSASLKFFPTFDPYRGDPRFDEIVSRRNALEAEGAAWAESQRPWLP